MDSLVERMAPRDKMTQAEIRIMEPSQGSAAADSPDRVSPAFQLPSRGNLILNVAGLALPVLAALIAIPMFMHNFGVQRFGAFSLLLAGLAYVSILDLGLASAATYRISAMLGRGEPLDRVTHLVQGAGAAVLAVGAVLAGAVCLAAPWLPVVMSDLPPPLAEEVTLAARVLALSLPAAFAGALLAGVLTAHRAFTQVNLVRIVSGVLTTLAPAVASIWSSDLGLACGIMLLVRVGAALVHWVQCRPLLRTGEAGPAPPGYVAEALRALLPFGGWLTLSNLIGPLMNTMDRFYLGAVRQMEEVAHYVTSYELASKVGLIPAAVLPLLFPLLVAGFVQPTEAARRLPMRLAEALVLASALPAALLAALAPQLMNFWLGGKVPVESTIALQVLAGGILVNCLGQVCYVQIQAMGRTDLIARLHVVLLPVYALLLWLLATRFGIVGAAIAWTTRSVIDSVVLCEFARAGMAAEDRRRGTRTLWLTILFGILLGLLACVPWLALRCAAPAAVLVLISVRWQELRSFLGGGVAGAAR
jgi:O-antigen/teichoic acid export membrane protein